MAIIKPLKGDSTEGFIEPSNINSDDVETHSVFIENASSSDTNVGISRDSSNNLLLADGEIPFSRKLVDALLENIAIDTVGTTTAFSYTSNNLTNETMTITSNSKKIRSIDYTYSGLKLNTQILKIYASDGTTVIAQVTRTYSYSGNNVSSIATTRDV